MPCFPAIRVMREHRLAYIELLVGGDPESASFTWILHVGTTTASHAAR